MSGWAQAQLSQRRDELLLDCPQLIPSGCRPQLGDKLTERADDTGVVGVLNQMTENLGIGEVIPNAHRVPRSRRRTVEPSLASASRNLGGLRPMDIYGRDLSPDTRRPLTQRSTYATLSARHAAEA